MFNLQNKNLLITGGASGMGLAMAQLFAKHNATIHIFDLNLKQAQEVSNDLNKQGYKAYSYGVDVSNHQAVGEMVNSIATNYKIDILINNAGVSHIGNAVSTTEKDFVRLFDINVKGTYNLLHHVLPHMKSNGGGAIINMSSIAANVGLADRFAYSMTKGAVKMMTLSVAKDYIADKIRCNCISPARVHTPFVDDFINKTYPGQEKEMFKKLSISQPIGRMGTPQEVAIMALYLCSDEASFVTGSDFSIDGGFTLIR